MREYSDAHTFETKIRHAVGWFIVGCIAFIVLEFVLIYLGYLTFSRPDLDWPSSFVLFAIAGIYLLWEMTMALRFKSDIPNSYEKLSLENNPSLYERIENVTTRLGMPMPDAIYLSSGIEAAVFCRPTILTVFCKPKKELVIGKILLQFLSNEELDAILYHEFGHYSSKSLDKKTPTYMVAQFAKSFTAIKKIKNQAVWSNMINSQIALFSYFSFLICSTIEKYYKQISQIEEYAADDVARQNIGDSLLAQTLIKVSIIRYNLEYLKWASRQLKHNEEINIELVLGLLCRYNKLTVCQAVPRKIQVRLSRLNYYGIEKTASEGRLINIQANVRQSYSVSLTRKLLVLHSHYAEALALSRSVLLTIHLDPRKHRLPIMEGKYQILLDGKSIGVGNFIKGYDINIRISPGKHIVETYAVSGIQTIPFEFDCEKGEHYLINMDFRVHLRNGYYDVFAFSSEKNPRQ